MARRRLNVVRLPPDLGQAGPEVGCQVVEPGVLQTVGGVGHGPLGRFQGFSLTVQGCSISHFDHGKRDKPQAWMKMQVG